MKVSAVYNDFTEKRPLLLLAHMRLNRSVSVDTHDGVRGRFPSMRGSSSILFQNCKSEGVSAYRRRGTPEFLSALILLLFYRFYFTQFGSHNLHFAIILH